VAARTPRLPHAHTGTRNAPSVGHGMITGVHQQVSDEPGPVHDPGDELHISFNSMQNGSQEHARAKLLQTSRPWTELFFEYSALLVLRGLAT